MAEVIDLGKKREEKDTEEDTILVCCAECSGELFVPLLYKNVLFLQCSNENCGEVYEVAELEEAEVDGM